MSQIQFGEDTKNFQTRLNTKRVSPLERFIMRCGVPQAKVPLAFFGIFIICMVITLVAVRKAFNIGNGDSTPIYIEDIPSEVQKNMPKEILEGIPSRKDAGEKGFTLIELLVVISIVSTLSSVILVGVSNARQRADNSYTTTQIGQYMRAIQMFVLENNRFPDPSPLSNNMPVAGACLGAPFCILPSAVSPNAKLNAEFLTVMPSLPNINKRPLPSAFGPGNPYQGIQYSCNLNVGSAPICKGIGLTWVVAGENQDCTATVPKDLLSIATPLNYSGNTYCYVTLQIQ